MMKIRALMSTDVVTVTPEASLKEAARVMADEGVSGLPVVDVDGKLVGILSEGDFVERTASHGRASLVDLLFDRDSRRLSGTIVADAMTTSVVSIGPDDSHIDAARLMDRHRVKRLPVVEDGQLVGIVSRSDLLGVFTRPDEAIEADIRDRIIGQVLALEPGHVDITVDQGRVTLEGTVPAKTEARLLEDLVGGVDGVLSVESGLRYLVDDTRRIDEPRPAGVPRPNW